MNDLDSRENLEASAEELTADFAIGGAFDVLYGGIIGLLDRQAAITELEWIDTECSKCGARENERDRDFAELQAQVDELTAERDELREKLERIKGLL